MKSSSRSTLAKNEGAAESFASTVKEAAPDSLLAVFSEQFYHTHDDVLRRFAASQGLSSHEIDDLVQTTWLDVCQRVAHSPRKAADGGLRAWIVCILHSKMVDHFRRTSRRRDLSWEHALHGGVEPRAPVSTPDVDLDEPWRRLLVRTLLDQLRQTETVVAFNAFHQRQMENRPIAAVAEALGITPRQVSTHHYRVLRRLRHLAAVHLGLPLGQAPDWL